MHRVQSIPRLRPKQSGQHIHSLQCRDILAGTIVLRDAFDTPLVTFTISGGKITTAYANDNTCTIVKDSIVNSIKKRIYIAFLGTQFQECETRYVIIKNKKIIAHMYDDTLGTKIKFNCNSKYSWDTIQEYRHNYQSTHTSREDCILDTSDSLSTYSFFSQEQLKNHEDILQSICSDFQDADAPFYTEVVYKTFDLTRHSTPT